jgi:maltose/moltooligosaccharide transporter
MKRTLSLSQLINMNIGFLGIQYSFGLQQSAINPIYLYLHAQPENLPYLNLAGPITGLLIQPIIGALSDNTWSKKYGRRKPYFLIGAIICSLCLFLFPFSSSLWMAVGLLWLLDAGNNTTMEPYRAFVADTIVPSQQRKGFLMQSMFTGLGITLANFSIPFFQKIFATTTNISANIPNWVYGCFFIGAVISITTILRSIFSTPEVTPSDVELHQINNTKLTIATPFTEVWVAIKNMPKVMWQLSLVYLFQWYALFIYWQFISLSIAKSIYNTNSDNEKLYSQAVGWTGYLNGTYNLVTTIVAMVLSWLLLKISPKNLHGYCLLLAAIGLVVLPFIHTKALTLIPIIGLGIAWASIMGVPYLLVVPFIPPSKYGVYMGVINMMIVIPMII